MRGFGVLLQHIEEIIMALSAAEKAEILKDVIGPSGNLRAPSWKIGNEYVVGFNLELYSEVFG